MSRSCFFILIFFRKLTKVAWTQLEPTWNIRFHVVCFAATFLQQSPTCGYLERICIIIIIIIEYRNIQEHHKQVQLTLFKQHHRRHFGRDAPVVILFQKQKQGFISERTAEIVCFCVSGVPSNCKLYNSSPDCVICLLSHYNLWPNYINCWFAISSCYILCRVKKKRKLRFSESPLLD